MRLLATTTLAFVLSVGLSATGCSDNATKGKPDLGTVDAGNQTGMNGTCSDSFVACGGNPTGTWTGDALCWATLPNCYSAWEFVTLPTITFALGSDGMAMFTIAGPSTDKTTMNATCYDPSYTSCAPLTGEGVTCTGPATACECTTNGEASGHWNGTYTVSGGNLTVALSDGPETYPFCVDGNTLRIQLEGRIYTAHKN